MGAHRLGLVVAGLVLSGCGGASEGAGRPLVDAPLVVGGDSVAPARIRAFLAEELGFTSRGGRVFCSYELLGREGARVFLGTVCEELLPGADSLVAGSGGGGPVALVLDTAASPVRLVGLQVPGDGGRFSRDVEAIFPRAVRRRLREAEGDARRVDALREAVRAEARRSYDSASALRDSASRSTRSGRQGSSEL